MDVQPPSLAILDFPLRVREPMLKHRILLAAITLGEAALSPLQLMGSDKSVASPNSIFLPHLRVMVEELKN